MIVLDASVVVDLLLDLPPHSGTIWRRLGEHAPSVAAPHLLDAEVGQTLRRFANSGAITARAAREAIEDMAGLPVQRYPNGPLLDRALDLRRNVTVYDALYIVLAEALDATLLTRDSSLARVPGHSARVEVLG